MMDRLRKSWSLLAVALALVAFVGSPAVALADTLAWSRTWTGPNDIPNPNPELPVTPVASALNAVSFADGSHGWAVGVRVDNAQLGLGTIDSLFAYTADGGSTWTSGTVGVAVELHAVSAVSTSKAWAVGDAGTIVHWNGLSWSAQSVPGWPANKAFRGVAFADALHGWVVGDGRGVAYTEDGGTTWTIIATPGTSAEPALRAVTIASATSAFAVGDSGYMRRLTATLVEARVSPDGSNLYSVTFADPLHAWAVGQNATVIKSSDGGATWGVATRPVPTNPPPSALQMRSVAFAGPYTGVIVATYQHVWRTSDAGVTWAYERVTDLTTEDNYELRGVTFAGSASTPVSVGRAYNLELSSDQNRARVYRGSWTGLGPQPPFPPGAVTVADGGSPRPRATVTWADNSTDEDGFVVERSQWSATGPFSHVATVGAGVTSLADSTVDWSSTWYYRVRSYRGELLSSWSVSGPFAVDDVKPVTTSDAKASYLGSATITFTAQDNAGGSGIAHVWSTLDGLAQIDATERTITEPGSHTLRFRAQDLAGNLEDEHVVTFRVIDPSVPDSDAPTTTADAVAYYANTATIHLTAADDGWGVAGTFHRLDGGAVIESSTLTVTSTGVHTLEFWSIDAADNQEATKTVTFTVFTPPSTTTKPTRPQLSPSTVTHKKSNKYSGYLVKHTSGTSPVRLYFYRYKSGKYVYYKWTYAKVSTVLTWSRYYDTTSVPYAGKWRVRAKHVHSSKSYYSSYTYFTAK